MKTVRLLALIAILVIVAQLHGPLPVRAAGGTIKIASQTPLSGGQSEVGTGMRNAVELAINQLKKPIEDMGFQVQFVPYDDQATPDVGVSNANQIGVKETVLSVPLVKQCQPDRGATLKYLWRNLHGWAGRAKRSPTVIQTCPRDG